MISFPPMASTFSPDRSASTFRKIAAAMWNQPNDSTIYGMLEIDANPNPLRSEICGPLATVVDGHATLTDAPGLGIVPDLSMLRGLAAA